MYIKMKELQPTYHLTLGELMNHGVNTCTSNAQFK